MDGLEILEIKKIFQIKGRRRRTGQRKDKKVRVTFGSIADRDFVLGHATYLPPDHSLEIVVPDYLLPLKRYLEKFAYKVRSKARDIHKTKYSTSIRMDDGEMSLYLAIREKGTEEWKRYTKEHLEGLDDNLEPVPDTEGEGEEEEEEDGFEDSEDTLTPQKATPVRRTR